MVCLCSWPLEVMVHTCMKRIAVASAHRAEVSVWALQSWYIGLWTVTRSARCEPVQKW